LRLGGFARAINHPLAARGKEIELRVSLRLGGFARAINHPLAALRELLIINKKTPLNFLQAGRTAGPEQRRGRYNHDANNVKSQVKEKRYKKYTI